MPTFQVFLYDNNVFEEHREVTLEKLSELVERNVRLWINIDDTSDAATITRLGELLHLHPLAVEDVLHAHQRAKIETYDDRLFLVLRLVHGARRFKTEQISMFLDRRFVLTLQEGLAGDCFDEVRERLRRGHGMIRSSGTDFLAYALLDAAVDQFFPVLEAVGERLETIEEEVLAGAQQNIIADIHQIRRDLLTLRRVVWPLREALHALLRDPAAHFTPDTIPYLRDCYDHTVRVMDLLESYRETGADLTDLHISMISHRMNEIMKVLTIISTIFIPLSFVAGVYGMNFNTEISPLNMPELHWRYGYVAVVALMATMAGGMMLYFYRSGWLSSNIDRRRDRDPEEPRDDPQSPATASETTKASKGDSPAIPVK